MSPDRWGRIEELFGSLFEMPVEERQRALDAVEDAELRRDVSALLSTHQVLTSGNGSFLDSLDPVRTGALLDESRTSGDDPATIGRYRIVRRLAQGGMGVVYLAHDPRLDRPIALKLLPPYLNTDPLAVRRLGDEARAASALDHSHIETVYEIGETDDGRVFLSMAYYDGETLRERIGRGSMDVSEVIDLGVQLAEGLAAAHRGGVIHRDIKPENILLTRDGVLKIVDFGVAKVVREGLASAGLPLGTAAYMSPEQTRGEALDPRTDLWSTGVVLYEMTAGARPFGGEGEALIHAIRNDPPQPLTARRQDLPARLAALVERCLEKDRESRPQTADDLVRALREASLDVAPGRLRLPAVGPQHRRRYATIAAAAAIPAVLIAAFVLRGAGDVPPPAAAETVAPGIAVLPFDVRGEDLDLWREGMVDLVSVNLDGVPGLRAIDSRTVIARWWAGGGGSDAPDLETAFDVARGTGASYAIIGNVVSSGSGMRLGAQIYRLEDERHLASLQVEGSPDSLFTLVDRLSIEILAAIWQGRQRPGARIDLSRITTRSLPALKAFLDGERLLRRADFEGAVAAYERAVAADSTFAFALYHLGLAQGWLGNGEQQRRADEAALRHADRLPPREALLLRATAGSAGQIVDVLQEVVQRYPDDADAWYELGDKYWHDGEQLLLPDREESEKAFRTAVELDPGFALAYIHLVNGAFTERPDSARAAHLIERYHRLAPNSAIDQENRIAFGVAFGDSTTRRRALAALDTLPPGAFLTLAANLDHPRLWSERGIVLARGPRSNDVYGWINTFYLFDNNLSRGRLEAALTILDDPLLPKPFRYAGLYRIHAAGVSAPDFPLDEALALPSADSLAFDIGSFAAVFFAGAFAADQGRWADHAAAVARLRSQANERQAVGDSANFRFATGAAAALNGQGLWRRGDIDRAQRLLADGQRRAIWSGSPLREGVNGAIRWWLSELALERDRPHEAARYFESFWNDPWAADRLGPIYEELGDPVKAREAYSLVVRAWRDADPELQARVSEARAAHRRLTPLAAE